MDDAAAIMGCLQAEREVSCGIPVETHAGLLQRGDRRRRLGDDAGGNDRIAEPVAGRKRIGKMQCRAVVGAHAGGDATLRPGARCLRAKGRAGDDDGGFRRQCQRGHQPRNAAADDHRASSEMLEYLGHIASILSTARRAATAIAGSTVTSWRFSSSAARILASVIRFICGQRLQGRMNSTSG